MNGAAGDRYEQARERIDWALVVQRSFFSDARPERIRGAFWNLGSSTGQAWSDAHNLVNSSMWHGGSTCWSYDLVAPSLVAYVTEPERRNRHLVAVDLVMGALGDPIRRFPPRAGMPGAHPHLHEAEFFRTAVGALADVAATESDPRVRRAVVQLLGWVAPFEDRVDIIARASGVPGPGADGLAFAAASSIWPDAHAVPASYWDLIRVRAAEALSGHDDLDSLWAKAVLDVSSHVEVGDDPGSLSRALGVLARAGTGYGQPHFIVGFDDLMVEAGFDPYCFEWLLSLVEAAAGRDREAAVAEIVTYLDAGNGVHWITISGLVRIAFGIPPHPPGGARNGQMARQPPPLDRSGRRLLQTLLANPSARDELVQDMRRIGIEGRPGEVLGALTRLVAN